MGAALKPAKEPVEQEIRLNIPSKKIGEMAENVRKAYLNYKKYGWKGNYNGQSAGTRAGGKWRNKANKLPNSKNNKEITYQEFDVNNRGLNSQRDGERFVLGSDGSVYYTSDHYDTFIQITD